MTQDEVTVNWEAVATAEESRADREKARAEKAEAEVQRLNWFIDGMSKQINPDYPLTTPSNPSI